MELVYNVCLLATFIELGIYMLMTQGKQSASNTLVFISILTANVGYIISITSSSEEAILIGFKLQYAAGIFLPILFINIIADACYIKVKKEMQISLILASFVTFAMSICCSDIYFPKMILKKSIFGNWVDYSFGCTHILRTILIFITFIYIIYITTLVKKNGNIISNKYVNTIVSFSLFLNVCYMMQDTFMKDAIAIFPLIYSLIGAALLLSYRDIIFYNDNIKLLCTEDVAYVILDKNMKFKQANKLAIKIFPEIKDFKVDKKVPIKSDLFLSVIDTLDIYKNKIEIDKLPIIERDNKFYEISISEIMDYTFKFKIGYIIKISDDTEKQENLKLQKDWNYKLETEISNVVTRLNAVHDNLLIGLATIIENRDSNTGGHIKRTSVYMKVFVNYLKKQDNFKDVPYQYWENIIRSAPLHDIGKIAIPDNILNKPGKFDDNEFNIMKIHPQKGSEILKKILDEGNPDFKRCAINIANYHHERWDGKGYPNGLKETEIPIEARMMALVDTFDALTSKRVYKKEYSFDKTFKIITKELGGQFDPSLGYYFLECREELEKIHDKIQ